MLSSIVELPPQVRGSLDEDDQRRYLEVYNSCDPKTEDDVRAARRKAWEACRELPSSFSFNIIASVDAVDKTREIIDIPSLKAHMDDYIDRGGNVQLDHGNYTVGTIWAWNPVKVDGMDGVEVWGNLFGGDKVYDMTRKGFIDGMNSLSVAGESGPGRFTCDEKGCYTRRDVRQLMEISVCRNPSNRYATMRWYNDAGFSKSSDDSLDLSVVSYTIHKDYGSCPIMSLKRMLESVGVECRATADGVVAPMPYESFRKSAMTLAELGVYGEWRRGEVLLKSKNVMMRDAFKRCWANGWADSAGRLYPYMPEDEFKRLWNEGLVDSDWRLVPDAELRGRARFVKYPASHDRAWTRTTRGSVSARARRLSARPRSKASSTR